MTQSDNFFQLFQWLREGTDEIKSIPELANEICIKDGWKTPFKLDFRLFENEYMNYDIIISPGNPVEIYINDRLTLEYITGVKSFYHYRHRLEQALEKMNRMHRVLRHPIPLSTAIALRKEARLFVKISNPEFVQKIIASKYLEVSYSIRVKDTLSGTVVELNGEDPNELKNQAIRRISMTVLSNEEFMELLENIEEAKKFKPENKESSIMIGGEENENRERRTY